MSLDHSSACVQRRPLLLREGGKRRASGSVPPGPRSSAAAAGAVTALALARLCQQAPAKAWVPGRQPALWPLTVWASTALTALSAVWASIGALGGVGGCRRGAALGTWPRLELVDLARR